MIKNSLICRFRLVALCFASLCMVQSTIANEWVSAQPQGPSNALGGPLYYVSHGIDGSAYAASIMGNFYRRASDNDPWVQLDATFESERTLPFNLQFDAINPLKITANEYYNYELIESLDGGQAWTAVAMPEAVFLRGTAVDDANVWLGWRYSDSSLATSIDAGATWSFVPSEGISSPIRIFANTASPLLLYALDQDDQRIKKSLDGGSTWAEFSNGTGFFYYMDDLAVDPSNFDRLYAASGATSLIYRTTNGAQDWNLVGVPGQFQTGPMGAIAVNPANTNEIIAGANGGGAFRSTDGGDTWGNLTLDVGVGSWRDISYSNSGEGLFAGDSGFAVPDSTVGFKMSNVGFSDFNIDFLKFSPAGKLYAGGWRNGLAVQNISSQEWGLRNTGLKAALRGVAIGRQSPDIVYAATSDGMFKSIDGGLTWAEQSIPGLTINSFGNVAIAPTDDNIVYAFSYDGLIRSVDAGQSWTNVLETSLMGFGESDDSILISSIDSDIVLVGSTQTGLWVSQDAGATWDRFFNDPTADAINSIAADPGNAAAFYLLRNRDDIWKSVDSGQSWSLFSEGPATGFSVASLIADSFVEGRLFVSSYVSTYMLNPENGEWQLFGDLSVDDCRLKLSCGGIIAVDPFRQGHLLTTVGYELYELQLDTDSDAIPDDVDNCTRTSNPNQLDANNDGYGNACDPDLNGDLIVNFLDVGLFVSVFMTSDASADFNGDGSVNFLDFALFQPYIFQPPGPGAEGTL